MQQAATAQHANRGQADPLRSARRTLGRREFLGVLPFAFATAPAVAAESRQERARRLLEECRRQLGGERFLKVRDVKQTGRAYSFYRQNVRGLAVITIYDRYAPMKESAEPGWLPVSRREVYTEKGDYYSLYQNGQGWEVTFRGARPLPPERIKRYQDSTQLDIFYFLRYRFEEPGMYLYHKGTEIIDNTPTDAIDVTDSDGNGVTYYLRQSDRMPVQQVYESRDPKTKIPSEEKTVYSKYRDVKGVQLPWNVRREIDGEKTFELFGRTAEINPRIDSSLYSLDTRLTLLPEGP
jgi:hypothetical protein